MPTPRTIKVFIASPGDLAVERRVFRDVLEELNGDFAHGARVKFEPLAWEDTVSPVGRRPQSEFNKEVEKCDVFILAMHRRWGQKQPDITPPATSYTEEEFNVAMARLEKTKTEPIIHVLFKDIAAEFLTDPGTQLKKVLRLRRKFERSGKGISIPFSDEAAFRLKLHGLLKDAAHRIIDENGDGAIASAQAVRPDPVPLPTEQLAELQKELERSNKERQKLEAELLELKGKRDPTETPKSKALRKQKTQRTQTRLSSAKREQAALRLAERAAKAALEGRVEEARQDFAKATDGTANLQVLYLAFDFYNRTGEMATAEELMERWLAISGPDAQTPNTAAALTNLGLIYATRGDLGRAEEMQRKSLAIHEKHARQEGIAANCTNLGLLYLQRNKLERAEEMLLKALDINEKFGRHASMAGDYSNLGLIYRRRGDLDQAEKMHENALAVAERMGGQEDLASVYGNLGLIYRRRGDLDRAEEMTLKSLAIEEKLGRQEGIAASFGNLGVVYLDQGKLDRAEEMTLKSLAINEKIGREEGIASDCANLGVIAKARRDLKRATKLWTKSRDLYAKIGMPTDAKDLQEWLDELPKLAGKAKVATDEGGKPKGTAAKKKGKKS